MTNSYVDPDVKQFLQALTALAEFLAAHDSDYWANKVQKCAAEVAAFNISGVISFNSYLGGMGSLNDLYFGENTKAYYELLSNAGEYAHKLSKKPYPLFAQLTQALKNLANFLAEQKPNSSWEHRLRQCVKQVEHHNINGLRQFLLYLEGSNSLNDLHFGEFNDKYTELLTEAKNLAFKINQELNR